MGIKALETNKKVNLFEKEIYENVTFVFKTCRDTY